MTVSPSAKQHVFYHGSVHTEKCFRQQDKNINRDEEIVV